MLPGGQEPIQFHYFQKKFKTLSENELREARHLRSQTVHTASQLDPHRIAIDDLFLHREQTKL